jgi:DNA-binding MarR family transcriptional regulator
MGGTGEKDGTAEEVGRMFRLLNEIAIVAQLSGTAFERVMPPPLNLPQFVVLNHMVRLGDGRTPVDLARAMQVTKGTMTNTLGNLERAGYVSIHPDPDDGRSKRVRLTAAGREAREAAVRAVEPELQALAGLMPAGAAGAILPTLETLRRILDERRA